jgi:uncharacterized protein YjiS (DUF1127 family)
LIPLNASGGLSWAARNAEERMMLHLTTLKARFAAWRVYRVTLRELSQLTDRDLADIGVSRSAIPAIARRALARTPSELAPYVAPRQRHAAA